MGQWRFSFGRNNVTIFTEIMKTMLALFALVALAASHPEEPFYSTRYDNFDAQALVSNIRLLKAYGNCFLDKGPCTPEGSDFKKTIPDAIRTSCSKCTLKQQDLIRTVIKAFKSKLPELWQELVHKEDPKQEYTEDFNKFLNGSN